MKKYFSKNAFMEACNQLKGPGMLCGIISVILVAIIMFYTNIDYYHYDIDTEIAVGLINFFTGAYNYVLVPISMFILFGFLTKRNASDFYHGLAVNRISLCNSFGCAVIALNVALSVVIILETIVFTLLCSAIGFPEDFFVGVLVILCKQVVVSLYFVAVIIVSMSLSGTMFTNVLVALMIMFIPRIIYFVIIELVNDAIPIVTTSGMGFLSGRYNLATGGIIRLLIGDYDTDIYLIWKMLAYTVIVDIIMYGIGVYLFNRRKSEGAGKAAVSERMQLVFRLIPAFMITMFPCAYIYSVIVGETSFDAEDAFYIVICYVLAIFAYVVYEVITTRKWSNIKKIMPGIVFLFVLDAVFMCVMFADRAIILNTVPANTKSISVNMYDSSYYYRNSIFNEIGENGKLEVEDSDIIGTFEYALKENIAYIDEHGSFYSKYEDDYRVVFHTPTGDIHRRVFLLQSDIRKIDAYMKNIILEKINSYRGIVPKSMRISGSAVQISPAKFDQFLSAYITSAASIATDKFVDAYKYYYSDVIYKNLEITYNKNGKDMEIVIPIYKDMTNNREINSILFGYEYYY